MNHDEFISKVAERASVPKGEAERLTRATLMTLAERITGGEARDLADQLPTQLKDALIPSQEPAEAFGLDEFVTRVARRAAVDEAEAKDGVRAVFSTLREAVSPGEFDDVMSQLPKEYDEVLLYRVGGPA